MAAAAGVAAAAASIASSAYSASQSGGSTGNYSGAAALIEQYGQDAIDAYENYYTKSATTLSPYTAAGSDATSQLSKMLGLSGTYDATAQLRSTPGYQWTLGQGTSALDASAAARGMSSSGAQSKGLMTYGQGLADTTYNTYMSQLLGLSKEGSSAAEKLSAEGTTTAAGEASTYSSLGNSLASLLLGQSLSKSSGYGSTTSSLGGLGGLLAGLMKTGSSGSSGSTGTDSTASTATNTISAADIASMYGY